MTQMKKIEGKKSIEQYNNQREKGYHHTIINIHELERYLGYMTSRGLCLYIVDMIG
jgi:hypothetical protein